MAVPLRKGGWGFMAGHEAQEKGVKDLMAQSLKKKMWFS